MGVKIDISTRQEQTFAGDVVEGVVNLDVTSKDAAGSSADELILKFVGQAKTRVAHQVPTGAQHGGTRTQVEYQEKDIISYDVQLAAFGGAAASGTHSFPFSVLLPPRLPPSMEERSYGGGSCEIEYKFEARLNRPGMLKFDAKGKVKHVVLARPEEVEATPVTMGPDTQKVTTCCCFDSGSMSIGFEADRSIVGLNEPLGVTVVASNNSSAKVAALQLEIKQETTWRTHVWSDHRKRTVASLNVYGSQLGELQRAAEKGSERGQSPTVIADAARHNLQELLAAGAGRKYEISLPDTCLTTFQSELIQVRHSLCVSLKTPTFINTPEVWMPLRVQPNAGGVEPPAAEAVPYSTAMLPVASVPYATAVDVDTDGSLKPVSVPQSAMTLVYSNELPEASAPAKM